jgi:hypothetical protein
MEFPDMNRVKEQFSSVTENLPDNLSELRERVPEMIENRPKPINPMMHAWLDYITAGTYLFAAGIFARRNKAAATAAAIHGFAVLGASLFTNYPGGVKRVISFHTHRSIDIGQMALAAAMPFAMGFAEEPEAKLFFGQALNEAAVVAMTDWDAEGKRGREWTDLEADVSDRAA